MFKVRYRTTINTTEGKFDYKIADESYEDDYGSYVGNHVVYKRKTGTKKWQRISPPSYAYSDSEAQRCIPQQVITCPTCKHTTYRSFPNQVRYKKVRQRTK